MSKEKTQAKQETDALVEEAFERAKGVLDRCSTPNGFFASPLIYNAVYARDALISSLGGLVSGEERYVRQWLKSMDTLMDRQSASGQIPNCVDTFVPTRPRLVRFGAMDASLWFVLTLAYAERLMGLRLEFHNAAELALSWLKSQDAHEDDLLEQQESSDWMDIICNRGHVLYTNVLYFAALELYGDIKQAHLVREAINGHLWSEKDGYFKAYDWKQEHSEWFDSAANCFAVAFGLADEDQTTRIFDYIFTHKLDEPFPVRTMHPPVQPGDKDWREYYRTEHELNMPDQYHNGGIWPWVGGLYVAALTRGKRLDKAQECLVKLAEANRQGRENPWEFNEWLHGISGEPRGSADQCWSAGMYIYAYTCVKLGREPVFDALESPELLQRHNLNIVSEVGKR